jgi:hypothetical protein
LLIELTVYPSMPVITTLSLYPRFAHSRPTMTNLLLERWIPTNSSYISGKPVEVTSREQVKLPIDGSSSSSLHGKNKFNYVEFVHDLFCSGWMPHTVSQGVHCVMVRFYTQLETERYVKENADEEVELVRPRQVPGTPLAPEMYPDSLHAETDTRTQDLGLTGPSCHLTASLSATFIDSHATRIKAQLAKNVSNPYGYYCSQP